MKIVLSFIKAIASLVGFIGSLRGITMALAITGIALSYKESVLGFLYIALSLFTLCTVEIVDAIKKIKPLAMTINVKDEDIIKTEKREF